MYYNNMLLSDNTIIFPDYMDKNARMALKARLSNENLTMSCGCSLFGKNLLPYTISADGRFIPLHKGYEHNPLCARNSTEGKRKISYQNKEDGTALAYVDFDARSFSVPKIKEESEENIAAPKKETPAKLTDETAENNQEETKKKEKEEKEPFDSLSQFILNLNNDTYKERISAGKGLLSADYFLSSINARLKKVYITGIDKPLRDLKLEEDYMSFFYQPVKKIECGERNLLTLKGWNKDYTQFLFEGTLRKELAKFEKRYGITAIDALESLNVMAAGFIYLQVSKKQKIYRVIGRLHLFIVNENGLYCRDLDELSELNLINSFLRENYRYKTTQFQRIIDDKKLFGIFTKKDRKQVFLYKPSFPRGIEKSSPLHIALATEHLSKEDLQIISKIID